MLVVARMRDPKTGKLDAKTVWVKAKSVAEALRKVHAVDFGEGFKVITAHAKGTAWEKVIEPVFHPAIDQHKVTGPIGCLPRIETLQPLRGAQHSVVLVEPEASPEEAREAIRQGIGIRSCPPGAKEPEKIPVTLPIHLPKTWNEVFAFFRVTYSVAGRRYYRALQLKTTTDADGRVDFPSDVRLMSLIKLLSKMHDDCVVDILRVQHMSKEEGAKAPRHAVSIDDELLKSPFTLADVSTSPVFEGVSPLLLPGTADSFAGTPKKAARKRKKVAKKAPKKAPKERSKEPILGAKNEQNAPQNDENPVA